MKETLRGNSRDDVNFYLVSLRTFREFTPALAYRATDLISPGLEELPPSPRTVGTNLYNNAIFETLVAVS